MNKTYKVRATRTGALQVVSELTSSVAAIGTKTVVAVATTMVAGAAIAAIPAAPTEGEGNVINDKAITWDQVEADANQNFVYNAASTQKSGDDFLTATEKKAFGKTMWVVAEKGEYATGIYAVGTGVTATNTGTIYVQGKVDAAGSASSWQLHGMGAGNGATAVNVGTIEVENAYGMYVGNSDSTDNQTKPTIINNGTIRVYKQGAGMELGGASGSKAINHGTITVEAPAADKINDYQFTHGVLIQESSDNEFTNYGTIDATNGTSAIEVKKTGTDNNTINLEAGSRVLGLVHVDAAATNTTLNLNGMQGSLLLKVKAGSQKEGAHFTLNVKDGANVTLEDGQDSTIDVANITNGTLTASIFQEDNAFKTVNLEEQGVFNITKLNSKTTAEANDNDRLLLAYDSTYNLNGGRLAVAGQTYTGDIRVGTNPSKSEDKGKGTLEVSAGSYTFADMSVRNSGTVNVAGGELTVNALDISKLGTVTVDGGTMRVNGALTIAAEGTAGRLTLDQGTFETAASNVYAASQTAHQFTKTDAWGKVSLDSNADIDLVLNGVGEYDIDDYKALQALVGDASKVNLVLNGTFKPAENATIGQMVGNAAANNTISVGETKEGTVTATLTGDVGVGALGVDAGTTSVKFSNNEKTLSLAGQNGTVLSHDVKNLEVSGTLALGILSTDSATVNAETVKAGTLEVNGDFTAQNVTLTGTSTVSTVGQGAKLVLDTLSATSGGTMTVEGAMAVTNVAANVKVEEGGELVLTEAGEGDAGISGTITADGITIGTKADTISFAPLSLTDTTAEGITWLTVSKDPRATAKSVISASAFTDEDFDGIRTIYYADATTKLSGSTNEVKIGANSAIVINAQAFSDTKAVIEGGVLTIDGGEGFLLNAGQTGSILVSETAGGSTNVDLATDNFFVAAKIGTVEGKDGTYVTTTFKNTVFGDDQELAAAVEAGMNRDTANIAVFRAIGDTYRDTAGTALTEDGLLAASEYVAAPVVAGTYNVAYDAAAEVTRAVMNHNVKGEGMGAWADVFYASNEAKKIYGGQGYSADVYGGVFGFDTVFSCGAKLGAALTIGQADADGERSFSKYSNDADFWGLSVYTGKNVADTSLYIGADLSYLWVDNDLKGTVAGASADESLDSTVFTVGLRADWTAYEGAFNVVPHAGVRYTAIDVDDYRGYASDSINVVELPVGVEVNGTFEASGWKVVPSVDFTIVPQVGDKDVKTAVGNVDVIDNLYNTTVGVEAVYGQYAFGLDAGYGFGSDDRQNATVKANFSYRF